jgi:hypothetical protein
MKTTTFLLALLLSSTAYSAVPVQLVVTAEGQKGQAPPEIAAGDITAHVGKSPIHIADLIPLRGDHAGLQLAIMIDDGAEAALSLQFDELRQFIREQPASTQIGIYYIRNGSAVPTQPLTADHEAAATHLRLPTGQPGIAVSPSEAISEFIKKWPATPDRREILLISSGIDLDRGFPAQNPYLLSAIADAQRAHVLVNSIYFAGAGHAGHSYSLLNYGRDYLSYLGDETGGEAYWEGLATTTTFRPYLDDLSMRLKHQYLLTFEAEPQKKGRFEHVSLKTEMPHVELMTADQAFVPGEK